MYYIFIVGSAPFRGVFAPPVSYPQITINIMWILDGSTLASGVRPCVFSFARYTILQILNTFALREIVLLPSFLLLFLR